jgi:hypothetical protein
MDYRCHDRVDGNELNAKHRNQKRAANERTYHTEEKVCHQSSSLVAEREAASSAPMPDVRRARLLLTLTSLERATRFHSRDIAADQREFNDAA